MAVFLTTKFTLIRKLITNWKVSVFSVNKTWTPTFIALDIFRGKSTAQSAARLTIELIVSPSVHFEPEVAWITDRLPLYNHFQPCSRPVYAASIESRRCTFCFIVVFFQISRRKFNSLFKTILCSKKYRCDFLNFYVKLTDFT